MNKTERTSNLKRIIKDYKFYNNEIKNNTTDLIEGLSKIDELHDFLEERCLTPNDWCPEEMKSEMMVQYFEEDINLSDLISDLENFYDEICETLSDMNEGVRKDEWEDFLQVIIDCRNTIDLSEVYEIEMLEEQLSEVTNMLEDLL